MPRHTSVPTPGAFDGPRESPQADFAPDSFRPAHHAPSNCLSRLLTLEQLSQFLQLHERTIRRLVAGRRMPCVRLGRTIRFDPADVARWLAARKEG
jgi:excisionase family DNA binding protein